MPLGWPDGVLPPPEDPDPPPEDPEPRLEDPDPPPEDPDPPAVPSDPLPPPCDVPLPRSDAPGLAVGVLGYPPAPVTGEPLARESTVTRGELWIDLGAAVPDVTGCEPLREIADPELGEE